MTFGEGVGFGAVIMAAAMWAGFAAAFHGEKTPGEERAVVVLLFAIVVGSMLCLSAWLGENVAIAWK